MKRSLLPLLVLPALLATGCTDRGFAAAMTTTGGVLSIAATVEDARQVGEEEAREEEREAYHRDQQAMWSRPQVYLVPEASAKDAVPATKPASFDPIRARNNLANLDLSACAGEGRSGASGHAKVTYLPSGAVSKVVIDAPRGLTPAMVACVGAGLGKSQVPPFVGSPIVVGTGFRVP